MTSTLLSQAQSDWQSGRKQMRKACARVLRRCNRQIEQASKSLPLSALLPETKERRTALESQLQKELDRLEHDLRKITYRIVLAQSEIDIATVVRCRPPPYQPGLGALLAANQSGPTTRHLGRDAYKLLLKQALLHLTQSEEAQNSALSRHLYHLGALLRPLCEAEIQSPQSTNEIRLENQKAPSVN